jgi:hypothetical protein
MLVFPVIPIKYSQGAIVLYTQPAVNQCDLNMEIPTTLPLASKTGMSLPVSLNGLCSVDWLATTEEESKEPKRLLGAG